MVIIRVIYDLYKGREAEDLGRGYKCVEVAWTNEQNQEKVEIFNTNNFVRDYFNMCQFLYNSGLAEKYPIAKSSTVDDFIVDNNDKYVPCYLVVRSGKFVLLYKKPESKDYVKLYMWKGLKPTYDQFKEIIR